MNEVEREMRSYTDDQPATLTDAELEALYAEMMSEKPTEPPADDEPLPDSDTDCPF